MIADLSSYWEAGRGRHAGEVRASAQGAPR